MGKMSMFYVARANSTGKMRLFMADITASMSKMRLIIGHMYGLMK